MHPIKTLEDNTRLIEIYLLRVAAYENSPQHKLINSKRYPKGLYDSLDTQSVHYIIEEKGRIIAAARVSIVDNLRLIPYFELFQDLTISLDEPFWFYSKLVVHPDYRGQGIGEKVNKHILSSLDSKKAKTILFTAKTSKNQAFKDLGCSLIKTLDNIHHKAYPYDPEKKTSIFLKYIED